MATQLPKNPVANTTAETNGAYLQMGILVGRLFNLGESSAAILAQVRIAMDHAKHDGIGQEA